MQGTRLPRATETLSPLFSFGESDCNACRLLKSRTAKTRLRKPVVGQPNERSNKPKETWLFRSTNLRSRAKFFFNSREMISSSLITRVKCGKAFLGAILLSVTNSWLNRSRQQVKNGVFYLNQSLSRCEFEIYPW